MKFINKILIFLKKIKPRYLLSLDSQFYNLSQKEIVYRFKVYGEHTFPKFTFDDIKKDKDILYDVHPIDLMKMTIDDHVLSQKKAMFTIAEFLRNNKYKLSNSYTEEILSGDEVCDNILLIEKIKHIDLYKIAYNTGFNHGRQITRQVSRKATDLVERHKNIMTLRVIERKD